MEQVATGLFSRKRHLEVCSQKYLSQSIMGIYSSHQLFYCLCKMMPFPQGILKLKYTIMHSILGSARYRPIDDHAHYELKHGL